MNMLGHLCLWTAVAASLASTVVCWMDVQRARQPTAGRLLVGTVAAAWLSAVLILLVALERCDPTFAYAVQYADPQLGSAYRLASLWAGQEGSLLFWTMLVACASFALAWARPNAAALAVMSLLTLCMGAILAMSADPFRTPDVHTLPAGTGQQLKYWAMLIHPPLIFSGYALCAVPFALAAAGGLTQEPINTWLGTARLWATAAWLVLGAGIAIGAWWAYTQLGWGGYWAWDPVENASLIPWLTLTAFLHAAAIHRRGGKGAALCLILALVTFILCIFGTLVTRGGLVTSVHSFGRSSIGVPLAMWLGAMATLAVWVAIRSRQRDCSERLMGPGSSFAMLWASVMLLTFIAGAVVIGTALPMIGALVESTPLWVGRAFYQTLIGPAALVGAALMAMWPTAAPRGSKEHWNILRASVIAATVIACGLFLLGVREWTSLAAICFAVLAAWQFAQVPVVACLHLRARGTSAATAALAALRTLGRANGSRIAHLGICLMLAGIVTSTTLGRSIDVTVRKGEGVDLLGWRIVLVGIAAEQSGSQVNVRADVTFSAPEAASRQLSPRRRHVEGTDQPLADVAIHSTLSRDLYAAMGAWDDEKGTVALHLAVLPGIAWIWIGAACAAGGGAVAFGSARAALVVDRKGEAAAAQPEFTLPALGTNT